MGRETFVCGDPLCASRRQQAGQGDGPRRSQKKSLFRYKNFDGTDRCNECYDEARKERAIMLAMPVANSTRAGGVPVLEGLQQGRKGKRKVRADELELLSLV